MTALFRRLVLRVLVLGLLVGGGAQGAAAAEIVDRIVAVVNGEIITLYELNQKLRPHLLQFRGRQITQADEVRIEAMQKGLLEKMVDEMLILDEAQRVGLEVSETEIENHIRQVKTRNGLSEERLVKQLRLEGMTREDYERKVRDDMVRFRLLSVMVSRKVLVSDDDILSYYEENRSQYAQDERARLGLILLEQGTDGQDLTRRIREGEVSFEDAAKQYSKGPGAQQGGDIGWLKWSEIAPEWKDSLKSREQGHVGEPFNLGGRQAILKLLEVEGGTSKGLEEVREEIRSVLHQPKFDQVYGEYITALKDKAIIDIRL